jgi:hypothetical protein
MDCHTDELIHPHHQYCQYQTLSSDDFKSSVVASNPTMPEVIAAPKLRVNEPDSTDPSNTKELTR